MGGVWYLDSGASFHMKGNRDLFSDFEEKDLEQSIDFGDDERYRATETGTVTFQRESGSLLRIIGVMYVPRLKKNLVSVVVLEDHGYDVFFSKGNVFLRHITMGQVKHIDSRVKNLYALEVQYACKALRSNEKVRDLVVERERVNYLSTCSPRRSLKRNFRKLWSSHYWRS